MRPRPISIPFGTCRQPVTLAGMVCAGAWELQSCELNIDSNLNVNENLTFQFRSPFPQRGDIVSVSGIPFQILEVLEDGRVTVQQTDAERIRGISSNAIIFDEVMDMPDPETMRQIMEGFARVEEDHSPDDSNEGHTEYVRPEVRVFQEFQQVPPDPNPRPNFFDISTVNRPADRVAFINNDDEMLRQFGPPNIMP